ncbi:MAG: proline--tRNA ligase [Candidatus Hadarchaeum sp.]|uniref:proline--tRNA ligase n=1 Tax=Candidatus Hadarchaeum sp. TaxID=2883567 RepID=UPI003174B208
MVKRERWRQDFSGWFSDMLQEADIMDTRYPVKGLYVWRPYGMKLRNLVFSILRQLHESSGHHEVLFPLLIPETLFQKEAEHIRGFGGQVYWVTHGGNQKLNIRLALRPTSETSMYPMFALWIRTHADLPIKVYQVVNVFRYETKMTKPMIRLREVTTFKEAHTAHATKDEAESQVKEAIKIYQKFYDELGVPYIVSKRPPWDTFAGAVYSIAFDTITPDGKALQIGTIHNLGQNFAKVYGLRYEGVDGKHHLVYQTCYGISERAVAAAIMAHGDDDGLCLPPQVAPVQVVIIPIPFKERETPVEKVAGEVKEELTAAGIRAHLDNRDLRPGNKFYYWERRGVPLRIEIGPKDVEREQITAVRRDTGEKLTIARKSLKTQLVQVLEQITNHLRERAKKSFQGFVNSTTDLKSAKELLKKRGGIVRIPWCGQESCGKQIAEKTEGEMLGEEIDSAPTQTAKCPICSRQATVNALLAKTY